MFRSISVGMGFIPRREMRSINSRGSVVFTYVLIFGLGKIYDTFKITILKRPFFVLENVLFTDGMGWMDGTGYQKCPLISFILRYIKQYTHVYLNI